MPQSPPFVPVRVHVLAARRRLMDAGLDASEAALDAELLAREAAGGWDRAQWLVRQGEQPPPGFDAAFESLVGRRVRREPVSSILGRREFWGLEFEVTRDVLAPRPETEIIVEEAIRCLRARGPLDGTGLTIADVGTGSGCLAISLAREFPGAQVVATDVSDAALRVADRNARRHGVSGQVTFRHASLLEGLSRPVDLIVSNPPYVLTRDLDGLPPEVREFEPHLALDGGPDGLDLVRALVAQAERLLAPGSCLIVEFGAGQEAGVRQAVAGSRLELVQVRHDLQDIPRTFVARRPYVGSRAPC